MNIIQPTQKRKAHSTLGEDQENAFSQSKRMCLNGSLIVDNSPPHHCRSTDSPQRQRMDVQIAPPNMSAHYCVQCQAGQPGHINHIKR